MQSNVDQEIDRQINVQRQLQQMDQVVRQYLSKDALSRYGTIKVAQPTIFMYLVSTLFHGIQQKKIGLINDAMLQELLKQLSPKKRTSTIRRI